MAIKGRFTDLSVEKIKPPTDREQLHTEGNGLYLRVSPKGKKVWLHYGKTRKWHKLGEFPGMQLKEARQQNDKIKQFTDKGQNPSEINLQFSGDSTVRDFFKDWTEKAIGKNGPWSPLYKKNVIYLFEADVLPFIGGMKIKEVKKADVNQVIQRVIDRGATGYARHVYRRLNRFFNLAAEVDLIETSPMSTMPTKGTAKTGDRVLKADEIKNFLTNITKMDMDITTSKVLEFMLRTGQRPGECAGICKDEVEGNWWTIPGERTKNGLVHRVYLTAEAIELLGDPGQNGYFFESPVTGKPIFRNAPAKALRRSIKGNEKTQKDKTPTLPMEDFTPRDLRRTCATHLAELGYTDDIIGAVLNHKKRTVTGIYNRHQYDKEKQKAMIAWAAKIEKMCGGKTGAKVIHI